VVAAAVDEQIEMQLPLHRPARSVDPARRTARARLIADPARIRIAEPPIAGDHFLTAHLERAHAAIPLHDAAADVGDRTPGTLVGAAGPLARKHDNRHDGYR